MEITKTFYAADRKAWRGWLAKNHKKEKDIWLIYYKTSSGKPRIPYGDAVDEALCFGWIDSTVKSIDDEKYAQRFSPRRRTSGLSMPNRERVRKLIAEKRMTAAGLEAIAHVYDPDEEDAAPFIVSDDVLAAIKADRDAWRNYKKLSESYKRIRIAYIESQRRHSREAFERSLRYFIKMTAQDKRFGFMRD